MGIRVCGLTLKEYFRLHGGLPPDIQERLVNEHSDLQKLLSITLEVERDIEQLAYLNCDSSESHEIESFLRCVRGLYGIL